MITAFVELSLAITPAYVIWGFEDNPSGDPKQLGRISQLTSMETLREVRVCVLYVDVDYSLCIKLMSGGGNRVFYARSYHPIQAGSIDGTNVAAHDNGVRRALLCYSTGLYDPFDDSKAAGDPYCTSHLTTEDTLREVKCMLCSCRKLTLLMTGASRGYAFVEYETEKEMHRAYKDAHHSFIDGREIIVDYNRQQLIHGWRIPRR
ncbi:hypothetical protein DY000_02046402 [Brassica cretica]|uniref:RRM domain-containing protein n=1 Tax=Brassica cretica TaxID=69181 RepID=A0ABQ7EP64_BRACR|nr:hypothetical protein DY000_02046402 [Brassica cretica]